MNPNSRIFVLAALVLVLLTSACGPSDDNPTATAPAVIATDTVAPATQPVMTDTATASADNGTVTPTATPGGAPVPVEVCAFCVDTVAQVVLTAPQTATFEVEPISAQATALPSPGITCNNVETVQDKQVLLCSGPHSLSFKLKVCDGTNCSETQVNLPACPLATAAASTATSTVTVTVTATPTAGGTVTATPAAMTATPVAGTATATATPTP